MINLGYCVPYYLDKKIKYSNVSFFRSKWNCISFVTID